MQLKDSLSPLSNVYEELGFDDPSLPPSPILEPTQPNTVCTPISIAGLRKVYHEDRPQVVRDQDGEPVEGHNLLQEIDANDEFAEHRHQFLHYPFESAAEWQVADWLSNSSLPQTKVDTFLKLPWVSLTIDIRISTHSPSGATTTTII